MHSMTRLRATILVTCFFGSLLASPAHAQEGMKRTILHQADLSGADGMEVISSIVELEPGLRFRVTFITGLKQPTSLKAP
jgi:hypothetical protein